MGIFLYKPHVEGPEGQVTSPDVIVDHVFVDRQARPVNLLTHDLWLQSESENDARAAYAVMAIGGGALLLPAMVLGSGLISVARVAWRLKNLEDHIGTVELNGVRLAEIGMPAEEMKAAGGSSNELPRGLLAVRTTDGLTNESVLNDSTMNRKLAHHVTLHSPTDDRWGSARPNPRYSVGPTTRDVPHYI